MRYQSPKSYTKFLLDRRKVLPRGVQKFSDAVKILSHCHWCRFELSEGADFDVWIDAMAVFAYRGDVVGEQVERFCRAYCEMNKLVASNVLRLLCLCGRKEYVWELWKEKRLSSDCIREISLLGDVEFFETVFDAKKTSESVMKESILQAVENYHWDILNVVMEQYPKLKEDKAFALACVQTNGLSLQYLGEFMKDKEIVKAAMQHNWRSLKYADSSLQQDKGFSNEAEKRREEEDILKYFATLPLQLKLNRLQKFVQDLFESSLDYCKIAFHLCPKSLTSDEDGLIQFHPLHSDPIYIYPKLLLESELETDPLAAIVYSMVLIALEIFRGKQPGSKLSIERIDILLLQELFVQTELLSGLGLAFTEIIQGYMDESPLKEKEIDVCAIEYVKQDGHALKYAHESLKKDKEIVMEYVKQDGHALKYAHESLKKDKEIVMAAVKQNGLALKYADESLEKDKQFVIEVVKQNALALQYADIWWRKDKQIVFEAVKQNGLALQFADESLKKDKQFVMEVVKQNGNALQYADEILRNDKNFVIEMVKQNGDILEYADESLRKDKQIVLEAIKQNVLALEYVDESLQNDHEIVKQAYQKGLFFKTRKLVDETWLYQNLLQFLKNYFGFREFLELDDFIAELDHLREVKGKAHACLLLTVIYWIGPERIRDAHLAKVRWEQAIAINTTSKEFSIEDVQSVLYQIVSMKFLVDMYSSLNRPSDQKFNSAVVVGLDCSGKRSYIQKIQQIFQGGKKSPMIEFSDPLVPYSILSDDLNEVNLTLWKAQLSEMSPLDFFFRMNRLGGPTSHMILLAISVEEIHQKDRIERLQHFVVKLNQLKYTWKILLTKVDKINPTIPFGGTWQSDRQIELLMQKLATTFDIPSNHIYPVSSLDHSQVTDLQYLNPIANDNVVHSMTAISCP